MEGKLKVTYIRSCIGFNKNQAKVLESLGLRKLNDENILPEAFDPQVADIVAKAVRDNIR